MNRRQFIQLASVAILGIPGVGRSSRPDEPFLSAATDDKGRHFVVGFDRDGSTRFKTAIAERAHAIFPHPHRAELVAVARRPGRFLTVIDANDGRIKEQISSPVGRHWFGHGVFSHGGDQLFVTENDIEAEHGSIAVLDANDGYRRISQWHSGGIGPHEILRLSNQRLFVCNGGILTHPENGRTPLNLDDMRPNISLIDPLSGELIEQHALDPAWRLASLRHADELANGKVAVVMQNQAASRGKAPLLSIYEPGSGLQPFWAPEATQIALNDYCGSVCSDLSGHWFAVSSPRGNRICIWEQGGIFRGALRIEDACGLSATSKAGEWLVSDGTGRIHLLTIQAQAEPISQVIYQEAIHWDNHIYR